uniref:Uncharacterized protein n=1 Tax=Panagrolaimus sp. ES5 TaxID=591445 RepID=A0AC34G5F2_9BILA
MYLSNHPFPLSQSGYINNGFDASQDSTISQHYHQHGRNQSSDLIGNSGRFDKSDNVKHSGLPSHLRTRNLPSNVFSFDRPESSISAQTEITTLGDNPGFSDDYEIPRSSSQPPTLSSIISVNPENYQSTESQNSKKNAAK